MANDGQQLNTSLSSNSRCYCHIDIEEINTVRNARGDCTIL